MLAHLPEPDVSGRIQRLRAQLGLTQAGLAALLGVSAASVIRWEHNRAHPSELAWQHILDAEREAVPPGALSCFAEERETAPAADSLSPPSRTNLPAPLTSFVGRERELAEVLRLLGTSRLLTLTGAGGSGKTRLALEVGYRVSGQLPLVARCRDGANPPLALPNSHGDTAAPKASFSGSHSSSASAALGSRSTPGSPTADTRLPTPAFPDGVWLVELAPIPDPAFVAQAIAATLRMPEQSGRSLGETLADFLKSRCLLLLLDNFEHLIEAAPLVARLLSAAPRLQILVTSRVVLRLSGEQSFVVPPLRLTDPAQLVDFDTLVPCEAVRLFVERAQSTDPGFSLDAGNAGAVVEVCSRLDGLPLAIELAAARSRLLSPRMLLARLRNRLTLLTRGPRNASERQQTLRNTIAWSYDLLGEPERTLFGRLAVFAGCCTLESVEAICGSEALEGLVTLLDSSLLQQRPQENGEPRFWMLETIREFGLEHLAASGEVEEVRRRHAEYFLAVAEAADPELRGRRQAMQLRRLEEEHDNLRAALGWSTADAEIQLRLAGALWWFWYVRGHLAEGSRWLEAALAPAGARKGAGHVKALNGAATLAWRRGDYDAATLRCDESLAVAENLADVGGAALALHVQALAARERGNLSSAKELDEQSLNRFQQLGDRWGAALALGHLAILAQMTSDHEHAAACYEQALEGFREAGDRGMLAYTLQAYGLLAELRGDPTLALARQREGLVLQGELGDTSGIAVSMLGLAGATASSGNPERATRLLASSDALWDAVGGLGPTFYRDYFQSHQAALRAALGELKFARAWTEGHALSTEQAMAYALEPYLGAGEAAAAAVADEPGMADVPDDGSDASARAIASAPYPDHLTAREAELLGLIAAGGSNRQVAEELAISVHTVERHIATIYRKIGARGKADATAYALTHGLTPPR